VPKLGQADIAPTFDDGMVRLGPVVSTGRHLPGGALRVKFSFCLQKERIGSAETSLQFVAKPLKIIQTSGHVIPLVGWSLGDAVYAF
jgi:hypothetical protein